MREGSFGVEALPGLLTLVVDMVKNMEELDCTFDDVFVEAGTGMTAAALIVGFGYLGFPVKIHVVQLAGNQEELEEGIKEIIQSFCRWMMVQEQEVTPHLNYQIHQPSNAKSFGSLNSKAV